MSENETKKPLGKIVIRAAAGALGETVGGPLGGALVPIIETIFGSIQVGKLYYGSWVEDLVQRIFKKCKKIPSNQLQEPPLNVIGPALEASKYYISIEEMREMFANLVAHACNKQMEHDIHPSFVNILTQITPLEANLLSSFRPKTDFNKQISFSFNVDGKEIPSMDNPGCYSFPERIYPIVNYYLVNDTQQILAQSNVMQSEVTDSVEKVAAAVTNLIRLGLIETNFQAQSKDKKAYDFFLHNDFYKKLQENTTLENGLSLFGIRGNIMFSGQYNKIVLEKGIVRLTQLGFNFIKICVLEEEFINENI